MYGILSKVVNKNEDSTFDAETDFFEYQQCLEEFEAINDALVAVEHLNSVIDIVSTMGASKGFIAFVNPKGEISNFGIPSLEDFSEGQDHIAVESFSDKVVDAWNKFIEMLKALGTKILNALKQAKDYILKLFKGTNNTEDSFKKIEDVVEDVRENKEEKAKKIIELVNKSKFKILTLDEMYTLSHYMLKLRMSYKEFLDTFVISVISEPRDKNIVNKYRSEIINKIHQAGYESYTRKIFKYIDEIKQLLSKKKNMTLLDANYLKLSDDNKFVLVMTDSSNFKELDFDNNDNVLYSIKNIITATTQYMVDLQKDLDRFNKNSESYNTDQEIKILLDFFKVVLDISNKIAMISTSTMAYIAQFRKIMDSLAKQVQKIADA